MRPTVSVVIITYNRATCVERCLHRLLSDNEHPEEIIVVDSSEDEATAAIVKQFGAAIQYVPTEVRGPWRLPDKRNVGLRLAKSAVIAFIDDDAFIHSGWLTNLKVAYEKHPEIGGIGGRAIRITDVPAEQIGRITGDGTVVGNFDADIPAPIATDHLLGCNMSFRAEAIRKAGGYCESFIGSCVREETDLCARITKAGYGLLFDPAICVDHVAAPYPTGARFDARYQYYGIRNHILFLTRSYGLHNERVFNYCWRTLIGCVAGSVRNIIASFARPILYLVAIADGIWTSCR